MRKKNENATNIGIIIYGVFYLTIMIHNNTCPGKTSLLLLKKSLTAKSTLRIH